MKIEYSEMIKFLTYGDRLKYLSLKSHMYVPPPPHLSQPFYKSYAWKTFRESIILRDLGFDLGADGNDIFGTILVHHINPLEEKDFLMWSNKLLDPNNVIPTSYL